MKLGLGGVMLALAALSRAALAQTAGNSADLPRRAAPAAAPEAHEPPPEWPSVLVEPQPSSVGATPPVDSPPIQPAERGMGKWYGWQILSLDALTLSLTAAGVHLDNNGSNYGTQLFALGALGYAFGSPAIHLAHGRTGYAVGSLSLRVVLPLMGAFVGASSGYCAAAEADLARRDSLRRRSELAAPDLRHEPSQQENKV
jgi:hypothetical protein